MTSYYYCLIDLQDLFQEVGVIQPSVDNPKQRQTPTPTSGISIPRPPSRRDDIISTVSILLLTNISIYL